MAQNTTAVFRATRVDVGPLAARGGGSAAAVIARALPGFMASTFADRIAATNTRAPVLVAQIQTIFMSDFGDIPGNGVDAVGHMDTLSGAGVVVGATGPLSTVPLTVHLPAGYSGAYYLPDIDVRRITSLCESFASWLRREMNL